MFETLFGLGLTHLFVAARAMAKMVVAPMGEWLELLAEALSHIALGWLYLAYAYVILSGVRH